MFKLTDIPGIRIKFWHYRMVRNNVTREEYLTRFANETETLLPHAGLTYCDVYYNDILMATGLAFCSEKDNYCKATGRDIARGRAFDNMLAYCA